MKILDTNQFISERIKVQPITNAELDKAKNEFEAPPQLVSFSSIKSINDIKPGWLVAMHRCDDGYDRFVAVCVPYEFAPTAIKNYAKAHYDVQNVFIHIDITNNNQVAFFADTDFKDTFPYTEFRHYVIDGIYKYCIPNLENIFSGGYENFKDWYEGKHQFNELAYK